MSEYTQESIDMQAEIKQILAEELPKFFTFAKLKRKYVYSDEAPVEYIHIGMACSDKEINRVNNQYPQYCSLQVERGVLTVVTYGGMGGRCIDLIPNKEDPRECYLVNKSYIIPFRQPKQGDKLAILRGIRKFCREYKKALITNIDRLMYRDQICMYNKEGIDYLSLFRVD